MFSYQYFGSRQYKTRRRKGKVHTSPVDLWNVVLHRRPDEYFLDLKIALHVNSCVKAQYCFKNKENFGELNFALAIREHFKIGLKSTKEGDFL